MDKKAAAAALSVSEKTISRYVSSGRLPSRYVRGKTGQVLDFEEAHIEALKQELNEPVERGVEAPQGQTKETVQGETGQDGQTTLAILDPISTPSNHAQIYALAELVKVVMASGQGEPGQDKPVPISEKMLLTVEEARALTGLSRGVLMEAIKSGDLPARTIGRGYKLRPGDVEKWLEGLFAEGSI